MKKPATTSAYTVHLVVSDGREETQTIQATDERDAHNRATAFTKLVLRGEKLTVYVNGKESRLSC